MTSCIIHDHSFDHVPEFEDCVKGSIIQQRTPIVTNSGVDDFINTHKDTFTGLDYLGLVFVNHLRNPFFSDNDDFYTDQFTYFIQKIKELSPSFILDIITCDINTTYHRVHTDYIEDTIGVNIRYSIDKTGTGPGSNWVMESDNVDIKSIYFTDDIDKLRILLDYSYTAVSSFIDNTGAVYTAGSTSRIAALNGAVVYEGTNITQVAGTGLSIYLLKSDGTVIAKGYNSYGTFGTGNTTTYFDWVTIPNLTNVVSMVSSFGSCVFLLNDGSLRVTGYNHNKCLSRSHNNNSNITTVYQPSISSITGSIASVYLGRDILFVLTTAGNLYKAGGSGQVDFTLVNTNVAFVHAHHTATESQNWHGYITTTGNLYASGYSGTSGYSQYFRDDTGAFAIKSNGEVYYNGSRNSDTESILSGGKTITSIKTTYATTMILLSDGSVYCRRSNLYNTFANGNSSNSSTWTVSNISNVLEIEDGYDQIFVLRQSDQVYVSGRHARLFQSPYFQNYTEYGSHTYTQLSESSYFVALLTNTGDVYAYTQSQLFVSTSQYSLVKINGFSNIQEIATNVYQIYGRDSNGKVYAMGYNYGSRYLNSDNQTPTLVPSISKAIKIVGDYHNVYVLNENGILYRFPAVDHYSSGANPVFATQRIKDVFCGHNYILVKLEDDSWGLVNSDIVTSYSLSSYYTSSSPIKHISGKWLLNQAGEVYSVPSTTSFTLISGLSNITQIGSAGYDHNIFLNNAGVLYGQGRNAELQLGYPANTGIISTPVVIPLDGVTPSKLQLNNDRVTGTLVSTSSGYYRDVFEGLSYTASDSQSNNGRNLSVLNTGVKVNEYYYSNYSPWYNGGEYATGTITINIDLGSPQNVYYLLLSIRVNGTISVGTTIQYSNDNSSWTTISKTITALSTTNTKTLDLENITTRYIKLIMDNSTYSFEIRDLKVFGACTQAQMTSYNSRDYGYNKTDGETNYQYIEIKHNGSSGAILTGPSDVTSLTASALSNFSIPTQIDNYPIIVFGLLFLYSINSPSATTVTVPSTVKWIQDSSMLNPLSVTQLTLPSALETLTGHTLHNPRNVTTLNIYSTNLNIKPNAPLYYVGKVANATLFTVPYSIARFGIDSGVSHGTISLTSVDYQGSAKTTFEAKGYTVVEGLVLPPSETNIYSNDAGGAPFDIPSSNISNIKTLSFWIKFNSSNGTFGTEGYIIDTRGSPGFTAFFIPRNTTNYSFYGFDSQVYINGVAKTLVGDTELISEHITPDVWTHIVVTTTSSFQGRPQIGRTKGDSGCVIGQVDYYDSIITSSTVKTLYNNKATEYGLTELSFTASPLDFILETSSGDTLKSRIKSYMRLASTSFTTRLPHSQVSNLFAASFQTELNSSPRYILMKSRVGGKYKFTEEDLLNVQNGDVLYIPDDSVSEGIEIILNFNDTDYTYTLYSDKLTYNSTDYTIGDSITFGTVNLVIKGLTSTEFMQGSSGGSSGGGGSGGGGSGGGGSGGGSGSGSAPCFDGNTLVLTQTGYKKIKDLKHQELIKLHDRFEPATVSMFIVYNTTKHTAPYLIKKNALSQNVPFTDTIISPEHAIVLGPNHFTFPRIIAKYNPNIIQLPIGTKQIYYHIETPNYLNSIMFANGIPVETYSGTQITNTYSVVYKKYPNSLLYSRLVISKSHKTL